MTGKPRRWVFVIPVVIVGPETESEAREIVNRRARERSGDVANMALLVDHSAFLDHAETIVTPAGSMFDGPITDLDGADIRPDWCLWYRSGTRWLMLDMNMSKRSAHREVERREANAKSRGIDDVEFRAMPKGETPT